MNPYAKQQKEYLKTQIKTASKEQLVLMLMDGVVRFSEQGRKAIETKDIEQKQFALVRAQDIVLELVNGLDHEKGGDIATNLARLYSYSMKRLVESNLQNDTTGIDEVQHIFRELREAWAVAMEKAAKENTEPLSENVKQSSKVQLNSLSSFKPKAEDGKPAKSLSSLSTLKIPKSFASTNAATNNSDPAERPRISIQG